MRLLLMLGRWCHRSSTTGLRKPGNHCLRSPSKPGWNGLNAAGALPFSGTLEPRIDVRFRELNPDRRLPELAGVKDLNLSDDQAAKLQGTEQKFTQQRVELAQRQRTVNEALRGQLQPGVAANSDSVRRLMDARDRNRTALAEIERNENREVSGYLTPVQQARYQMMREQLRRRIQEIREQRRRRSEMMGPRRAPRRPREAKPPRRRP